MPLPYLSDTYYILRYSNGEEIHHHIRFQSQVESDVVNGLTAVMSAYQAITRAIVCEYGLRYHIYKDNSLPADTEGSKKAVIMVRLSDGELQAVEIEAVDDGVINTDNTIDLNNQNLNDYIDDLAQFANYDGRTIDQTDGVNGMVSALAV